MKKKNLKNFIGQIFILKREKDFISLLKDDCVYLQPGSALLLLDIIPYTVLLPQMNLDGYITYDIRQKAKKKKLKHLASFLHGQDILYFELDYTFSIREFYFFFRLANANKLPGPKVKVPKLKVKATKLKTISWPKLSK